MESKMSTNHYAHRLFVIFILLCASLVSHAGINYNYIDGSTLKNWIDASDRVDSGNVQPVDFQKVGRLDGYVIGVHDSWEGIMFCGTDRVRAGQLIALVTKYVRENPDQWHHSGSNIVIAAIAPSCPCKHK
jgi:hypothetical protein